MLFRHYYEQGFLNRTAGQKFFLKDSERPGILIKMMIDG